jgi:hypothetical protein
LALIVVAAIGVVGVHRSTMQSDALSSVESSLATQSPPEATPVPAPSDDDLQQAADGLLAAVNPERPENEYFTDFAQDALRWMTREHAAGRLTVAFLFDTASIGLPPGVLMAATRLDGQPTIFVAKPRFATFLREGGRVTPPFTQQQKNDFTVALIHEIVHLQRWAGNPSSREIRAHEESKTWLEVNLRVVRPWRALNRPLHRRFIEVDDAFRSCGDVLPCPTIARLVRLTP